MKFRIIATIVLVLFLIVLTFIFAGGNSSNTDNTSQDGTTDVQQ